MHDGLGSSIAIGGGWIAVGAHERDGSGADSGAVYLFNVGVPCAPATGLRVGTVNGSTELHLTWTDAWDATGYSVYEDTQPDGEFRTFAGTATSGVTA